MNLRSKSLQVNRKPSKQIELLYIHNHETMSTALQNKGSLPVEYEKVWTSYQSQKNRQKADDHTKALIRKKVLALQECHGITNYRIYTDMNLNPGNLNAWLKHGDCNKVSLNTARNILQYVTSLDKNFA